MSVKFERIDTQEKFDQWRAFAATFDHDTDRPTMPLVMITNERNQAIGHYSQLSQPIIFPAFHPSISRREFRDAVEAISAHYCLASMGPLYPNGVLFTALPRKLPISPQKLGLESLELDLYQKLP